MLEPLAFPFLSPPAQRKTQLFFSASMSQQQPQIYVECRDDHGGRQSSNPNPIETAIKPKIEPVRNIPSSQALEIFPPKSPDIQQQGEDGKK